jgi:pyridoxine 4-dehydrogenase
MKQATAAGTYLLADRPLHRMGYGTMQLAGPGVFGPPRNRAQAMAVLRAAIEAGVDHIDTSDFYGPHVTNQIVREALHPYPPGLTIVTKVGAMRGADGAWLPAFSAEQLRSAVFDNLRNLQLDVLDVVNLRLMFDTHGPAEGSIEEPLAVLAELQRQGLIRHLGLSNATPSQVQQARRIVPIACVQNHYNVVHREDDPMIDELAASGVAYVPFFPLGGFSPLQSTVLDEVAKDLGATPKQVALAWLLRRSKNILLIPGTSSPAHLQENLGSASLPLPPSALERLDRLGSR